MVSTTLASPFVLVCVWTTRSVYLVHTYSYSIDPLVRLVIMAEMQAKKCSNDTWDEICDVKIRAYPFVLLVVKRKHR